MLSNIYNQTITILNKLRRTDTEDGSKDEWYKTVLTDAAWYTDSARSAGNHDVYIGTYITILLPFHDEYYDYIEWKKLKDKSSAYTVSNGDYIIRGTVDEDITADNVVKVMENYGERVCYVRHHNANYKRFGATVQLKIEGV